MIVTLTGPHRTRAEVRDACQRVWNAWGYSDRGARDFIKGTTREDVFTTDPFDAVRPQHYSALYDACVESLQAWNTRSVRP
jgi:hypothetical protein